MMTGMPQPDFVPTVPSDQVRVTEELPTPEGWVPDRPAEIKTVHQPTGPLLGAAGPDQGYGYKLAKRMQDKLQLLPREHATDAVVGALAVALKRASLFGRAPVIHDFRLAYGLFGFLGGAPQDLLDFRRELFSEASHFYATQRKIADMVPESTLRLTPDEVIDRLSEWRSLLDLSAQQ